MVNTKDVLERLRALRVESDMRQEHIARRLGIDRTTYVRKERGAIPITTEEWLKLADAMKKDPSYFFSISAAGINGKDAGTIEILLVRLYRSLSREEKNGLVLSVKLILKGVRRKRVRDALLRLKEALAGENYSQ